MMEEQFQIVRIDFWDYRHRGPVFSATEEEAKAAVEKLERENDDPLSCYTYERVKAGRAALKGN